MKLVGYLTVCVVWITPIDGQSMFHTLMPQGAPPKQNHFRDMMVSFANRVPNAMSMNSVTDSRHGQTASYMDNINSVAPTIPPTMEPSFSANYLDSINTPTIAPSYSGNYLDSINTPTIAPNNFVSDMAIGQDNGINNFDNMVGSQNIMQNILQNSHKSHLADNQNSIHNMPNSLGHEQITGTNMMKSHYNTSNNLGNMITTQNNFQNSPQNMMFDKTQNNFQNSPQNNMMYNNQNQMLNNRHMMLRQRQNKMAAKKFQYTSPLEYSARNSIRPPMAIHLPPSDPQPQTAVNQPMSGMSGGTSTRKYKKSFLLTPQMKTMVNQMATQLGHAAYYQAHGCVDPTATLLGKQAKMAKMSMMMGCDSAMAAKVCHLAQVSTASLQEKKMMMMMRVMMPGQYGNMRKMMEKCLSPTSMMSGLMMGGKSSNNQVSPFSPPHGAALPSPEKEVNCGGVLSMVMMNGGGEGFMSPESMESIGVLRNKYLPMTCQENILMGVLPYRLCCPGYVRPPTMQEAMMLKAQGSV